MFSNIIWSQNLPNEKNYLVILLWYEISNQFAIMAIFSFKNILGHCQKISVFRTTGIF